MVEFPNTRFYNSCTEAAKEFGFEIPLKLPIDDKEIISLIKTHKDADAILAKADILMDEKSVGKLRIDNLKELFEKIIKVLKKYLELREEYYTIIALWIIGTYIHDVFPTYPFLFFNAMRGSGKTRTLKLISTLSKRGNLTVSLSEAVLFRTAKGSTICIDEVENIASKEKKALRELLNAAYKRGLSVKRTFKVQGKSAEFYQVESFDVYCAIAMANIWGMEDVLGDRCLNLVLDKSNNMKITRLMEIFEIDEEVQFLKKELETAFFSVGSAVSDTQNHLLYNLWNKTLTTLTDTSDTHQHHTLHTYTDTTNTKSIFYYFDKIYKTEIDGRNFELTFPLLLLAIYCSDEIFEKTLEIVKKIVLEKKEEECMESRDIIFIDFISNLTYSMLDFVSLTDLSHQFTLFLGEEIDKKYNWVTNEWIGKACKRLNFILEKRRLGRGREIRIDIKKAREKIRTFKPDKKYEEKQERITEEELVLDENDRKELIHHKCSVCGNTPCGSYTSQGKPICSECVKYQQKGESG